MIGKTLVLVLSLILFMPQAGFSWVKITTSDGRSVELNIPSCAHIQYLGPGLTCHDLAISNPSDGGSDGGWRKQAKERFKINDVELTGKLYRGKTKLIKGENQIYYKRWFLGKKNFLGTLKNGM